MAIGVSGLMSGLDTESIISQMMQIEQRPIVLLQRQEASYQSKISALGTLKSALAELQTAASSLGETDLYAGYSSSSGNTDVMTTSASDTAVAGTYNVEVNSLASAQSVKGGALADSDTTQIGTGTLTIQMGTNDAVDVTIDSSNNTLAGIATAINEAGTDVSAGVVHDGTGNYYLVLTASDTGTDNTISFTVADDDGVDTDASGLSSLYFDPATETMDETQAASNATLNVNGIAVERASNTIDDLIEGVTLKLKEADPGNPFDVKVSRNVGSITSEIKKFVEKYNSALDTLNGLQSSNVETGNVGALQGDSTPRLLQSQLQSLIYAQVDGVDDAVNGLSALGFEVDSDGQLSFDSSAFSTAYESNREDVVNFFTQTTEGSEGFAQQLENFFDSYLDSTSGVLTSKVDGLNDSIDRIEDQVERMQGRLDVREETLRNQFNALESLLAQFQSTSGQLTQQLESISNLNAQISKK